MTKLKTLVITIAVGVPLAFLLWKSLPRNRSASPPPPAAPVSPAHERASLLEQLERKPGHSPVLLRLAQLDLESGNPADARRWLDQLLAAEPGSIDARLELGRALYALGDSKAAREQTETILAADPRQPDALYNLGAIAANEGRFNDARVLWSRAVEAAPSSNSGRKSAAALSQLPKEKR